MDDKTPKLHGRVLSDPSAKASQAIGPRGSLAIGPLTGRTASLGSLNLPRGIANMTLPTALASKPGGITDKEAMQSQNMPVEQQSAEVPSGPDVEAVGQHPEVEYFEVSSGDEEPPSATMEQEIVDAPSKVGGHRETVAVQDNSMDAIDDNERQRSVSPQAEYDSDTEMTGQIEGAHTSPELEEEIDMLDKYAFNFDREAYAHHVPQHFTHATTLYVGRFSPQTTSLAEHRAGAEAKEEIDICPPLIPRLDETRKVSGRKDIECVWVGMMPSEGKHYTTAAGTVPPQPLHTEGSQAGESQADGPVEKRAPKRAKKGTRIVDLSADDLTIISYDPNALRVVAKKSSKATKNWFLYALLNPDPVTKLCQGWKVGLDEVYYFKAFRVDEAKSYMPRKQATQEKIRSMIFPDDPSHSTTALSKSEKSVKFTSPPVVENSSKSHKEEGASKKTDAAREVGGAYVQDVGSDRNRAVSSPLSSVCGYDSDVGNGGRMADLDAEDLDGVDFTTQADRDFDAMVSTMMHDLSGAGFEIDKVTDLRADTTKKNDPTLGDLFPSAFKTRNTEESTAKDKDTDDNPVTASAKPRVSQHGVNSIAMETIGLVMEMSKDQNLAGLHQVNQILKCIKQRCNPSKTNALGLYLNVPPGDDGDSRACCVKLRELLDLFPELEEIDMDNHVLAWMIRGLQITGQSVDIELLPLYLMSFSELFKVRFKDTSNHQTRLKRSELTDMVCQARDDAEKLEAEASKDLAGQKGSSPPYTRDTSKTWKTYSWTDPREDLAPE